MLESSAAPLHFRSDGSGQRSIAPAAKILSPVWKGKHENKWGGEVWSHPLPTSRAGAGVRRESLSSTFGIFRGLTTLFYLFLKTGITEQKKFPPSLTQSVLARGSCSDFFSNINSLFLYFNKIWIWAKARMRANLWIHWTGRSVFIQHIIRSRFGVGRNLEESAFHEHVLLNRVLLWWQ